jgi:cadmium resistance protein CadD (predicted permease)
MLRGVVIFVVQRVWRIAVYLMTFMHIVHIYMLCLHDNKISRDCMVVYMNGRYCHFCIINKNKKNTLL